MLGGFDPWVRLVIWIALIMVCVIVSVELLRSPAGNGVVDRTDDET
jgi:hypothetical protein